MGDRRTKERRRQEQKLGQTNHSPHKSSPEEYSPLPLTHIRAPRGRRIDCELDHAIRKKLLTVRDHPGSKANMVASRNWVPPLFVVDLDQGMSVRVIRVDSGVPVDVRLAGIFGRAPRHSPD